ncbi:hypothetical protein [Kitasatospora aburaviensis]|uniref:Uncharacterized protein n=1 Tax=Kitasatospora aburaviensis TaxID=67265 RepID=A0ABW1F3F0_9ACTN
MSAADELKAAAAAYAKHHSPETQTAWRDQQASVVNHGNAAGGSWSSTGSGNSQPSGTSAS